MSGLPQAIVNIPRNGGCSCIEEICNQCHYLDQGSDIRLQLSERHGGAWMTREEYLEWARRWVEQTGHYYNGESLYDGDQDLTTHIIVSFPPGTDPKAAYAASRSWAEDVFGSGRNGGEWDYITAFHTNRPHPHAHVIVNRRSLAARGEWLAISHRNRFLNYDTLRESLADAAALYGIELDASSRAQRGIEGRGPTNVEYRQQARIAVRNHFEDRSQEIDFAREGKDEVFPELTGTKPQDGAQADPISSSTAVGDERSSDRGEPGTDVVPPYRRASTEPPVETTNDIASLQIDKRGFFESEQAKGEDEGEAYARKRRRLMDPEERRVSHHAREGLVVFPFAAGSMEFDPQITLDGMSSLDSEARLKPMADGKIGQKGGGAPAPASSSAQQDMAGDGGSLSDHGEPRRLDHDTRSNPVVEFEEHQSHQRAASRAQREVDEEKAGPTKRRYPAGDADPIFDPEQTYIATDILPPDAPGRAVPSGPRRRQKPTSGGADPIETRGQQIRREAPERAADRKRRRAAVELTPGDPDAKRPRLAPEEDPGRTQAYLGLSRDDRGENDAAATPSSRSAPAPPARDGSAPADGGWPPSTRKTVAESDRNRVRSR